MSTGNEIGDTGATSLSESLKSNTTLTALDLRSEDKRKKTHKDIHQQFTLSFLFSSTDNEIGDTGATSLSESLKSNTTLTRFNLSCEDIRKKTQKDIHKQFTLVLLTTDNKIGERGATSLSESLKSNTTLTELDLNGEDKRKKDTQKTFINNSLLSSRQQ